jgi:ferric-dicitrate binding protein FerR (iron transport regulator)
VYLLRAAAAAVLLGIVAAVYLWLNPARRPLKDRQAIAAKQQPVHDIAPGGNKAVLTLANGTSVVLDDTQTGLLAKQGGTQVVKAGDGLLTYHKNQPVSGAVLYNTLSTPRGGQYQLVLPDGTRVWMNASSSIRFPAEFREKERNITLSGEAYFEVAQDAAKPFKVTVAASGGRNGFTIDVLGTHFNVMAYEEEQTCSTTLLEGAVRIGSGGTYNKLLPGEQAKIDQRNTVKIVHPDMDEVMAWKNGEFLFNSYGIEKIMRQLSRWYDVEVVYEGKIPEGHFSGAVNRNNNISQVLKILEAGGVRFLIEGRKLIVKS